MTAFVSPTEICVLADYDFICILTPSTFKKRAIDTMAQEKQTKLLTKEEAYKSRSFISSLLV